MKTKATTANANSSPTHMLLAISSSWEGLTVEYPVHVVIVSANLLTELSFCCSTGVCEISMTSTTEEKL